MWSFHLPFMASFVDIVLLCLCRWHWGYGRGYMPKSRRVSCHEFQEPVACSDELLHNRPESNWCLREQFSTTC
jgi:hypothetical protein